MKSGKIRCVNLVGGRLDVQVDSACMNLDKLCGFASRMNSKRRFLFISKVLGKHWPVRPKDMRATYQILSKAVSDVPGPIIFIGMAETATGLSQGIYDSFQSITNRVDALYIHTTRYHASHEVAFEFKEPHSHATDHLLHIPEGEFEKQVFECANSVIIVDDEISTGNTIANLLTEYISRNKHVKHARIVSLTNWLSMKGISDFKNKFPEIDTDFIQLLHGSFEFTASKHFEITANKDVTGGTDNKDQYFPNNWGRFGIIGIPDIDFDKLLSESNVGSSDKVLVLGTGEFSYPPFLFAEFLEQKGIDVQFQSTTRSPIMKGCDIADKIEFVDNYGDGIANFIYNVGNNMYSKVLICYEHTIMPHDHQVIDIPNSQQLYFRRLK